MLTDVRHWRHCAGALLLPALLFGQQWSPPAQVIDRIAFRGNTAFSEAELQALLQTRPAHRGVLHRMVRFYTMQLLRHPATPAGLLRQLQRLLAELEAELPAFDPRTVEADIEALRRFYMQQGFHWVQVQAILSTEPDRSQTLTFILHEGPAARIDTVVYHGLEDLPASLAAQLPRYRRLRAGMLFREAALIEEAEALQRFLRENGYPSATYERPQIYIMPERNADSIVVHFHLGQRQRFGAVQFVETTTASPPLTERIRRFCLEFTPGQWYDIRALERTRLRLLRLGVFELVRLDTSSARDSTVDILITTRYRRPREALLSTSVYRTLLESAPNIAVEAHLSDVNLFGGAERGSLFGQIALRDPLGAWERKQLEYEFQFGAGLALPYLLHRLGLQSQLTYGTRFLAPPLRLEALSLRVQFPVEFAPWTWMTTSELGLNIRAERPLNYPQAAAAVDSAPELAPFLRQYERLYTYTAQGRRLFPPSDITVSLTLGADHRDHPALPSRGHAAMLNTELGGIGAIGLAQYTRLQLLLLGFASIAPRTTLAGKLRLGSIWWRNRQWSYVPYDRHFFAGGANSIRGWASRSLWDPHSGGGSRPLGLASYIGAALLVEGSAELRWRFPPLRMGPLSPYVENFVLTAFLDWGNAYNRLTPELYGTATLGDIVRNLALSLGIGWGYVTDVGPLRLEAAFRVHDPSNRAAPWFFQRPAFLRHWILHLGLGYAF